ncbi:urease subunit gamma [Kitasatospora sp. NPDC058444]|uniref:urease subunit gamma n=1 Tax=Kitasatospora sp. NPDC058444 TaxID=3346504 RepID=UPI0036690CDD
MQLTPTERDRLLIFTAAELARARRARGLRLNVPEAIALVSDTVCEAARDGLRLAEAVRRGRRVLSTDDVLPGVPDLVTEIQVEAVFEDGTRLAVIADPFGGGTLGAAAPGAVLHGSDNGGDTGGDTGRSTDSGSGTDSGTDGRTRPVHTLAVRNTADVPISVTSHFHFFEVNPRLAFDRAAAYGTHLAVPAGSSVRFDPGATVEVGLVPIGGERVAIGFAGLVDGPLDSPRARQEALRRAAEQGYLGAVDDGRESQANQANRENQP